MPNLREVCEIIYHNKGQSAVFDFVLAHYPKIKWAECSPCEISSPIQNGACLVCGSNIKKQPLAKRYINRLDFL
jgi:hypothetical protein